jgi:hypothetical protein
MNTVGQNVEGDGAERFVHRDPMARVVVVTISIASGIEATRTTTAKDSDS